MNEGEDRKDRQASSYDMKIIKKEMKEEKGKWLIKKEANKCKN